MKGMRIQCNCQLCSKLPFLYLLRYIAGLTQSGSFSVFLEQTMAS